MENSGWIFFILNVTFWACVVQFTNTYPSIKWGALLLWMHACVFRVPRQWTDIFACNILALCTWYDFYFPNTCLSTLWRAPVLWWFARVLNTLRCRVVSITTIMQLLQLTYRPVVVQVCELVRQALEVIRSETRAVFNHVVVRGRHCSLTHRLAHKEEIKPTE